jgi:hypothetical protein
LSGILSIRFQYHAHNPGSNHKFSHRKPLFEPHLKNEPWDRTLKEKGKFQKVDYMLSIDSEIVSLSNDEAKERVEEISEVYQLFGAD